MGGPPWELSRCAQSYRNGGKRIRIGGYGKDKTRQKAKGAVRGGKYGGQKGRKHPNEKLRKKKVKKFLAAIAEKGVQKMRIVRRQTKEGTAGEGMSTSIPKANRLGGE